MRRRPIRKIPAGAAVPVTPDGEPIEALARPRPAQGRDGRPVDPEWAEWEDERLLDLRMCDLSLSVEGSFLEERIAALFQELEERRITFRPHYWLSDEWFTPDDVAGFGIAFYLAHPRLAQLELDQMLEVEGGTVDWCMRILRHETGHALDNAFALRRRRRRQRVFRKSSKPYPDYYTPRPFSRSYVQHLDMWYAQSHPDEDFAETFAVWLDPESDWRNEYAGWPALRKLEYMDELMRQIASRESPVRQTRRVDPLSRVRRTLRTHYRRKRNLRQISIPHLYDRHLRQLFSDASEFSHNPTAARFLTRIRKEVRRRVRLWTGVYQYTIDQVFEDMLTRCRDLGLRLATPEDQAKTDFTVLLTVQTMTYLHSGRHRIAL